MSKDGDETARERVVRLIKQAKKAGKEMRDISTLAIKRVAEEFNLEAKEIMDLLETHWKTVD